MIDNRIIIKNGVIITPDKTIYNQDILVEGKKITQIDTGINLEECEILDVQGNYIVPGFVDMHCCIQDPGYDNKETMLTAGTSAIHGGFTTLTINPLTLPCIDNKAIVEYIISKSQADCPVSVIPYGSLTLGGEGTHMAEIGEMQLAGAVAMSDGDNAIQDTRIIRNIMHYCSMFDIPVITHCEEKSISKGNLINDGRMSAYLGITGSPISAETLHVMRNLLLAEEYNAKLHLTHISTEKSVELIRMFKRRGARVTCETSPQYFSLDESATNDYNTYAKVNPPLRTSEDVKAVIRGLQDGTIDTISSDHRPDTIDSKDIEFDLASYGISSLETTFPVCYTYLVEPGYLSIEALVQKLSYKPAQILTLNKGRIVEGGSADFVIIDPKGQHVVRASKFKSKARYSPYENLRLKGSIKYTFVQGRKYIVHDDILESEDNLEITNNSENTKPYFE